MKRAREEEGQDQDQGENDATKNGGCGGSERGGEELRNRNKLANLREDTSRQKRSGLTDTNSNQMLVEEGDNPGVEEKQAMANKDVSEVSNLDEVLWYFIKLKSRSQKPLSRMTRP